MVILWYTVYDKVKNWIVTYDLFKGIDRYDKKIRNTNSFIGMFHWKHTLKYFSDSKMF